MATAEQTQKRSPIERAIAKFGQYFEERGIGPKDLPAAIIIHEILGMAMALGFWTACYALQPSKTLARPLIKLVSNTGKLSAAENAYNAAMAKATQTVQRSSWLRSGPLDPARLTTSLAESLCLRATIKPATFVFKIWASAEMLLFFKSALAAARHQNSMRQVKQEAAGKGRRRK